MTNDGRGIKWETNGWIITVEKEIGGFELSTIEEIDIVVDHLSNVQENLPTASAQQRRLLYHGAYFVEAKTLCSITPDLAP